MLNQKQINEIELAAEEFFRKMTIEVSGVSAVLSSAKDKVTGEDRDVVDLDIKLEEPQILIGQQGQTLFEIQHLLKNLLNKKFQSIFYLNLDINDYKKKKVEYLKSLAKDTADQVALTKEPKMLPPMTSYERRIIHAELSQRTDVITESQGDGFDRHITIKPK